MKYTFYFILLLIAPFVLPAQVLYDFETGDIQEWLQVPEDRWEQSDATPLSGAASLKHKWTGTDKDRISIELPAWQGSDGTITWRFLLRHGYNPSSSNNWAVFLTCNKDANGMISTESPDGYAVGVNLNSSDDSLKFYMVSGGSFNTIIKTTINWEQDIKTSGIGAIEIRRKPDGTFSMKASATGSFLDMIPFGSVVDNTHAFGGYFGISYSYTSSAAGKLWVDDVSIDLTPVNPNDNDSQIQEPDEQVQPGYISSLANNADESVNIFKFKVTDQGSSDGLPTRITKLRFAKIESSTAADWAEAIAGIVIRNSSGDSIPLLATYIMSNAIEAGIEPSLMVIENGSTETFTLAIYLNQGGTSHGETFQLKVDNEEHGWETDFSGSNFPEVLPAEIVSNVFTVQVVPTHLFFLNYPEKVIINKPFSVSGYAGDVVGNMSTEFSSSVNLELSEGGGTLSPFANLVATAQNGIVTWSEISYSAHDVFKLEASALGMVGIVGNEIEVLYDTTTVVQKPAEQVEGGAISSLNVLPGQAIEALRFKVIDAGNFDNVPTYIQQITIKRGEGENLASFSKNIAGVIIKVGSTIIPVGTPHILTSSITIPVPKNSITIPSKGRLDLSLWIYLNEKSLEDDKNLLFMIDSVDHGFTVYPEGSIFATQFDDVVQSNPFKIDVEATRVSFTSVPQFVGLGEEFSVKVGTVDEAGNVDVNSEAEITLSKNSGEGWLTIPLATTSASSGEANWSGLTYFQAEPFTILASVEGLNDAVSPLIYCADKTSTILAPVEQISNQKMSSLSVDSLLAMEAFRFEISDGGDTDGLPTNVSQLSFHGFGLPSDLPLNKILAGAFLIDEQGDVVFGSATISSNQIVINFENNTLNIPDGESVELTLKVFLKKGGLTEGSTLNLFVPSSSHGWLAYTSGSGFPDKFDAGLVGPVLSISVEKTQLSFIDQPFSVEPSEPFTLKVAATDKYSNIDLDFSATTTLGLDFGAGNFLVDNNQVEMVDGLTSWSKVSISQVGKYGFVVTAGSQPLFQAYSQTIWCGSSMSCLYNEDFESGYPESFPYSTVWNTSSVSPIEGDFSLKHSLAGVSGESSLALPLVINSLGEGAFEWSFIMRNGNWDPSVDNGFWVVLSSDTTSITLGDFNGYVAGVNFTGSTDFVTLWRVNGSYATAIVESDFDWNEAETVGIKVTRSPNGDWDLFLQPELNVQGFLHAGKANDRNNLQVKTFGIGFKYTTSRAGEFWVDNLKTCKTEFPPVISSANALSLTSVAIDFSETVNSDDAALASNYRIEKLNGEQIDVIGAFPDLENETKVTLRTSILPQENLILFVNNIRDMQGNACTDSIEFGLGSEGTFGNVIINEIMAKPIANGELPNVEYIELFNSSGNDLTLAGWKLKANDNIITIPDVTIVADNFLILASTSGVSELSPYGQTVGVSSFPSLVNSGMSLALIDNASRVISWVDYSENWYGNEIKKTGGFSLEKIDPNNLVVGAENWIGSNDSSGGTPGRENSVLASNPDLVLPSIVGVNVESAKIIGLTFSETMDSLSVTLPSNYILSGIGEPLWVKTTGPKYNEVNLEFEAGMNIGEIYDLCIEEGITDFSGNTFPSECIQVAVPEEPVADDIVVNEVLFNPYSGGVDFVEVFNNSQKTFDLKDLWIANRNVETAGLNEFYAASDSAWLLFPQSYAVLSINPTLVEQYYFVENESALVWTAKMPSYANDEGYVLLLNSLGDVVDEFHYNEDMHLPLLSSVKGVSLERIHPSMVTNETSSWQSAAQAAGFATPTAKNSQYMEPGVAEDSFEILEEVFSPDGDGFNDVLLIDYNLPEDGYIANIIIFDSMGRKVRRLASNFTLGTSGTLKWDGVTDANTKAPVGAYVIFIETFTVKENVKKNLKQYKKTCVVATKFGG